MKNDPRSYDRNFYNCVKKPEKNSGLQRGLNPWPREYRCDALPTELWSHWRWEQVNFGFICSRERYEGEWCIWNKSYVNCGYCKIAIITARIILHLISYPQFTYDLFHMHHSPTYLSREHMNPKLTCSQRQWLHSSVGRASHRYREVTGSSPVEVLNFFFFRLLYAIVKIAIITARIILHLISYPQFTYDLFHMHHSPSYLSREHMNPKLTCSQRQWLHSSVGRASHRYREVTGSSPVEVLNFFQASLRNCKNCDHNCEDHSSFDFISAVHIWIISYASFTFISFTGTYESKIDLLPTSVAS